MGYLHIDNLYKAPELLQCYALEKIHGTSAHVAFRHGGICFFSGGEDHARFVSLFDQAALEAVRDAKGFTPDDAVVIYGEAFGGKQQGMSKTYGTALRFMAFDVEINGQWLDVLSAANLVAEFGLTFVPYERGPLSLEWLNTQRDRDSSVAVEPGKMREGVVIRPIREMARKDGSRVIVKHKRPEFRETATVREVDPAKVAIIAEANAVADEWVTPMRLSHVLQKTPFSDDRDTGKVIKAMQEDVRREADGEIVWSKDVEKAIGRATAKLLHPQTMPVVTAGLEVQPQ
jgi:hypothetical protein